MIFCSELGLTQFIFEGDCQLVVQQTKVLMSAAWILIPLSIIYNILVTTTQVGKSTSDYRDTNMAARGLAELAYSLPFKTV